MPADPPLHNIRAVINAALTGIAPRFGGSLFADRVAIGRAEGAVARAAAATVPRHPPGQALLEEPRIAGGWFRHEPTSLLHIGTTSNG